MSDMLYIIHMILMNAKVRMLGENKMEKKKVTQEDIMNLLDSCYEKCLN